MSLTHIYKKESEKILLLDILNYTLEEFKNNPQACYPEWSKEEMIASEIKYEYPCIDSETQELREMTKYEKYKKNLYELQENEVEFKEDILILKAGQYLENGEIKEKIKPEGVKIQWNWELHEWEEKATNLEIVQSQYNEYEGMDTPSVIKEMEMQDPALATELINMLIELRGLIYTLSAQESQPVGYAMIHIPIPSEALKKFKNKFNKI